MRGWVGGWVGTNGRRKVLLSDFGCSLFRVLCFGVLSFVASLLRRCVVASLLRRLKSSVAVAGVRLLTDAEWVHWT